MFSATIVALGDSTTAGTPGFRSPIEAPPDGSGNVESQYTYWLMKARPGWRVLNRGVDGETSDRIRARFERDVVGERGRGLTPFSEPGEKKGADPFSRQAPVPDAVVIIAGVNDIYQGRSVEAVERELEAMYDTARAASIPVLAGTIIPYNTATDDQNRRMHAVNKWIREYAAGHAGMGFCDTRGAVGAPGQPDRLVSSPDDLHPSPDGYRRMALALEPAIEALLAKARPGPPIAVS